MQLKNQLLQTIPEAYSTHGTYTTFSSSSCRSSIMPVAMPHVSDLEAVSVLNQNWLSLQYIA